jgi:uncharacterized membrane protein YtjA (UPF0391 family)
MALADRRGRKESAMLNWSVTFFVIAIVAALLGFGGVAGMSADIGWLFALLAVLLVVVTLLTGRSSPGV